MGFTIPQAETAEANVVSGTFQAKNAATAYINLWLPSDTDSGKKKFGTIYLDDAKEDQKMVIEYLKADDGNLVKLINTMIVDFRLAVGSSKGFKLPTDAAPEATNG